MSRTARAFDAAGYDRWVTVTLTPTDWRQGMARLRYLCKAATGRWEWAWVRESGRETGMLHCHAVVRGGYLDQPDLCWLARKAGFGWNSWIAKPRGSKAGYAAKAAGYCAKAEGGWKETLDLNGGRGWHQSRHYTEGVPMRKFVPLHAPGKDAGPWQVIDARQIDGFKDRVAAWVARGEEYAARTHDERQKAVEAFLATDAGIAALRKELGAWDFEAAHHTDRPLARSDRVVRNRKPEPAPPSPHR